jgi:hypothetical protein
MKKQILAIVVAIFGIGSVANADVVDINPTGFDAAGTALIERVEERIMNEIVNDFRTDQMPRWMSNQLQTIQISAQVAPDSDGVGGVLAFARVDRWLSYESRFAKVAVAQVGSLFIDPADLAVTPARDMESIVLHEAMHAMGFSGTGFEMNDNVVNTFQYIGRHGVDGFREDSGIPFAPFVPLEQAGGGGTAGSHWAVGTPGLQGPGFQDVMIGFFDPANDIIVSNATIGALNDLHLTMTDDGFQGGNPFGPRGWKRPPVAITSVPEPASASLLVFGLAGIVMRRRRG